ncbi:hypothetical protein AJ79_05260 [Helicocarpus griseus UAMH5409]|uniref:Uncharacterized protein n=1 Tax=Helicocarpus griseus UAMH5409 TaxID=1447875 RepID=A0A2B7XQK7_9EURO|nr:hypothetical protein AJ79_05260 [Helicocarpus griseus UAMH5409]
MPIGQLQPQFDGAAQPSTSLGLLRQDPSSYLLVLLLTAHPNLHLNHSAMASVAQNMLDPGICASIADIERALSPLVELSRNVRGNIRYLEHDEENDEESETDESLDSFAGEPENGVWIGQARFHERRRRLERARQASEERARMMLLERGVAGQDAAPLATAHSTVTFRSSFLSSAAAPPDNLSFDPDGFPPSSDDSSGGSGGSEDEDEDEDENDGPVTNQSIYRAPVYSNAIDSLASTTRSPIHHQRQQQHQQQQQNESQPSYRVTADEDGDSTTVDDEDNSTFRDEFAIHDALRAADEKHMMKRQWRN